MPESVDSLLAEYERVGLEPPSWAYPLPPSIPFIGENYGRWGGLLVYASAENLSHYVRKPETRPAFLEDDRKLNRHRATYDEDPGLFFPRVHMAPFEDGSLLVATWYYIWRRHGDAPSDPRTLLESIAAANFCKFSIDDPTNHDYVGDRNKVTISVPYVRADLEVLRPQGVILPRTIWQQGLVQDALRPLILNPGPLALPQFNPRVVNTHLKRHEGTATKIEEDFRGTVLPTWIGRMKGYREGRPYWFLAEMDEVLEKRNNPRVL